MLIVVASQGGMAVLEWKTRPAAGLRVQVLVIGLHRIAVWNEVGSSYMMMMRARDSWVVGIQA